MNSRAARQDADLAEEDHLMARRERHLIALEKSWCHKCWILLRPFEIIVGIVFFLLALLIFISLLLTK